MPLLVVLSSILSMALRVRRERESRERQEPAIAGPCLGFRDYPARSPVLFEPKTDQEGGGSGVSFMPLALAVSAQGTLAVLGLLR